MSSHLEPSLSNALHHPIDIVQDIAARSDWSFNRTGGDLITLNVEGQWRNYTITLSWSEQDDAVQLLCSFDLFIKDQSSLQVYDILNRINTTCWTGAFSWIAEKNCVLYRYTLLLSPSHDNVEQALNAVIQTAVKTCELYYPALQLVTWDEKSPEDALELATLAPCGCA